MSAAETSTEDDSLEQGLSFTHFTDNHGAEIEDTDSDVALLGGDYGDLRTADDPYELAEMVDSTLSQASNLYEEVKAIPGNHEVESGPGIDELYEGLTDEEGEFEDGSDSLYEHLTGKEGEDPEQADNLFELVVGQYENVEDVSYSSFEIDGYTVVAGGSHQDPEIPKNIHDLLESEPEMEELGYEDDKLDDVADMMSGEDDYGFWGNLPYVGDFFKKAGEFLGVYGEEEIDPEELSLEDIPEDERTEAHEDYIAEIENAEEEYRDQIEALDEKKETLQSLIDEAEKPVIAFDHGIPMTDEEGEELDYVEDAGAYKGSIAWKDLAQENDIEGFLGGHFHGRMDEEVYDTRLLNPGEAGYQEVALDEGLEVEQYELDSAEIEEEEAQEAPSREEQIFQQAQMVHQMEELGGPDEFLAEAADEIPEGEREVFQEQLNGLWDRRERVKDQAQQLIEERSETGEAEA